MPLQPTLMIRESVKRSLAEDDLFSASMFCKKLAASALSRDFRPPPPLPHESRRGGLICLAIDSFNAGDYWGASKYLDAARFNRKSGTQSSVGV